MPLNEANPETERDRWPLQFDLEGIPRQTKYRKRLLDELRAGPTLEELENHAMNVPQVKNVFAGEAESLVDGLTPAIKEQLLKALLDDQKKNVGGVEFDLSKPPVAPYAFREYPKAMYSHDGKRVVNARDRAHEAELVKQKFSAKPQLAKKDDDESAA